MITLTNDERNALYAELSPETKAAVDTIIKMVHEDETKPAVAEETPTPVVELVPQTDELTEHDIAHAANVDSLDTLEIAALHIVDRLARGKWLGRLALDYGGLEALYRQMHTALEEMAGEWDQVEIEQISEALRGR